MIPQHMFVFPVVNNVSDFPSIATESTEKEERQRVLYLRMKNIMGAVSLR